MNSKKVRWLRKQCQQLAIETEDRTEDIYRLVKRSGIVNGISRRFGLTLMMVNKLRKATGGYKVKWYGGKPEDLDPLLKKMFEASGKK